LTRSIVVVSLDPYWSMRKRVHVNYSGRVQGVGFRYSTREVACGFEVAGFVQNLPDGRVEMVAEGTQEQLTDFLDAIEQSHLGSHIKNADVTWQDAQGEFKGFQIRY